MRAIASGFVAATLLVDAATAAELQYGQPYGCNGERFVVSYCRGDSDAGNYVTNPLDNYCKVTYIDRPRTNGFLPETAELRGDILKKLVACGGTPTGTRPAPASGPTAGTTAPANQKDVAARADALIDAWIAAYNRGDYDSALASLREYIKLYPNHPTGFIFAGHTYTAKGDKAAAERAFLQAQRVAPEDAKATFEVGKLYLEVHEDNGRARTELRKVLALKSATSDDLVPAGELLARAGDPKSATEAFRRAVQLPGQPRVLARGWVGFGRSQYAAERYPQAIVALKEALRLDPKNEDAHWTLAAVYEHQGNLAGAVAERRAIVQLNPNDARAHLNLGNAYAAQKQAAPAIAAYDQARALAPKDPGGRDLLSLLADDYEKLGRSDLAITALRASIDMPHDSTPEGIETKAMSDVYQCTLLGRLLASQKKYPDVVRLYLARGACNGLTADGPLGAAYLGLGQAAKAVPLLEKALEGFEDSVAAEERALAGGKLTKDERDVKATMLAETKAEGTQDLYALGRAYLLTGRAADARRIARTLQRYDAKLASKLTAEVGAAP